MPSQDPSKPRSLRSMRQAVKRLTDRFRWLGMDQGGSMLVAGIVILGIFAVMFSAGVRQEGSAQELDIRTAHRRKALDVAKGGMDKLLMEFTQRYKTSDCSTLVTKDEDEHWELIPSVSTPNADTVVLTSKATVAGVSETVKVTLRKDEGTNPFSNFLGGITMASREEISGNTGWTEPDIEQPVYYDNGEEEEDCKLTYKTGFPLWPDINDYNLEKTTQQINIPTSQEIDAAVRAQIAGITFTDYRTTLPRDGFFNPSTTIKKNTWITPSGNDPIEPLFLASYLTVEEGKWLVIEGSLKIWGLIFEMNLDGNIVVIGGSAQIGGFLSTKITGRGMIICLPPADNEDGGITMGQIGVERLEALTLISTGKLSIGSIGSFSGGLLAYGNTVSVDGAGEYDLSTCCLVSDTNIAVDAGGKFKLRKGEKEEWSNQPIISGLGTGYGIVSWEEGNT